LQYLEKGGPEHWPPHKKGKSNKGKYALCGSAKRKTESPPPRRAFLFSDCHFCRLAPWFAFFDGSRTSTHPRGRGYPTGAAMIVPTVDAISPTQEKARLIGGPVFNSS
jgi:hypothetical protein